MQKFSGKVQRLLHPSKKHYQTNDEKKILMRCVLKSDFCVIIRVLPVVESWSWTEGCSVAVSERKCCYACRSCSHLCVNQWLYIICFLFQRDFQLSPLCVLLSTSLLDKVDQAQGPDAGERNQTNWARGSQKFCRRCSPGQSHHHSTL